MSSINSGIDFIYANETSEEHGVMLVSSVASTSRSGNIESRNIITTRNLLGEIFNFHGVSYDDPLVFDIILVKSDGTFMDNDKERELKKWLMKNKRHWLQIEQNDLADIQYYSIGTKAEIIDVGLNSTGLRVEFSCDTYHAWSNLKTKTYTSTSTLSFGFNSVVDFDEYIILPNLKITCLGSGTVSIKNNTTNETILITECTNGETIYLDCLTDKISSSTGNVIIGRWNKQTISIVENLNQLTLTGNFKLELSYRLPIRVGA